MSSFTVIKLSSFDREISLPEAQATFLFEAMAQILDKLDHTPLSRELAPQIQLVGELILDFENR